MQGPTVPTPVGATSGQCRPNRPHARGRNEPVCGEVPESVPTVPTPVGATRTTTASQCQRPNRPHARGRNDSRLVVQAKPQPTVPTPVGATPRASRRGMPRSQPSPRPWAQLAAPARFPISPPTVPTPVGATLNGRSTVSPIVRGDGACREDRQPQPTTLLRTSLGLVSRRRSTCRRQSRPLHARLDSRRFSTRVAAGLSPHSGHGR